MLIYDLMQPKLSQPFHDIQLINLAIVHLKFIFLIEIFFLFIFFPFFFRCKEKINSISLFYQLNKIAN